LTTDPALAEHEAQEAQAEVDRTESELASGQRKVPFARLHRIRDKARHAELTAQAARANAEQQHREARAAALAELAGEIDAAAAQGGAELPEALQDVAAACARVRQLAVAHDAGVAALRAAAIDLGCRPPAPGGPREIDARIAVTKDGVQHDRAVLYTVSDHVRTVIERAVAGDVVTAAALVKASGVVEPPKRADHYLRGSNGQLIVLTGELSQIQLNQINKGDLVPLTEPEIRTYLAGER
jgi:hypothetical protein